MADITGRAVGHNESALAVDVVSDIAVDVVADIAGHVVGHNESELVSDPVSDIAVDVVADIASKSSASKVLCFATR